MPPGPTALYRLLRESTACEASEHGPPTLIVDGSLDLEATIVAVEELFAEALTEGPRAETLPSGGRCCGRRTRPSWRRFVGTSRGRGQREMRSQSCVSSAASAGAPHAICLQDSGQPSIACWRVLSLQLRSGGSSSQCAPDRPSSVRWNGQRNDRHLARRQWARWRRPAESAPRGRRAPRRYPTGRQQIHRPKHRRPKGGYQYETRHQGPAPALSGAEVRTPTAGSVAWCSTSDWSPPVGSGLLTSDASSIASDPDWSRQIVWLIKRMINDPPTDRMAASAMSPNGDVQA
jgi:hypothetical protein